MIKLAVIIFFMYMAVDVITNINNSINPFLLEYQAFIFKYISDKYLIILLFSILCIFLTRYLTKMPPSLFKKDIFIFLKFTYTVTTILFFSWFFYKIIKLENVDNLFNTFDSFYNKIKINNDAKMLDNFTQYLSNNFSIYNNFPGAFKQLISMICEIIILFIMAATFIINFILKIIHQYFFFIFIPICTKAFIYNVNLSYYHLLNKINRLKQKYISRT